MDSRELWRVEGDALIAMRRARGWNRKTLARAARLSPHTVARMERGVAVFPRSVTLVADVLGVPVDVLRSEADWLSRLPMEHRAVAAIGLNCLEIYQQAETERSGELLREFCKALHPDVVLSTGSPIPLPYEGVFRGIPGIRDFLGRSFDSARRLRRAEVEQVTCLNAGRVALTVRDDVLIPELSSRLVGTVTLLFGLADALTDRRILSIHIATDAAQILPLADVACDDVPPPVDNGVTVLGSPARSRSA